MRRRRYFKIKSIGEPVIENTRGFIELITTRLTNELQDIKAPSSVEELQNKSHSKKRG